MRHFGLALLSSALSMQINAGCLTPSKGAETAKFATSTVLPASKGDHLAASGFKITEAYAQHIADKVDQLIRTRLYNAKLAKDSWPKTYAARRADIIKSRDLKELGERLNAAIAELHSSHCEFAKKHQTHPTHLDTLFCQFNKKLPVIKMNYTGIITGGVNKEFNCVRNVLDGSPGAKAGVRRNDVIESIDGQPFVGECNFVGTAGKSVHLKLRRSSEHLDLTLVPKLVRDYEQYVDAMEKSTRIFDTPEGKIGYVHYWCGGSSSHEMFEHILGFSMTKKDGQVVDKGLSKTDGLILDLRDGYGGASGTDLDMLYRDPASHPDFIALARDGEKYFDRTYYDKPVVALINGGSRSAKEMFAWGLKNSGRAKLVGLTTAGFVLAGQFAPLDERCALYLAVSDVSLNNERLEGKGVSPDIEVPDDAQHPNGYDEQFEKAKVELLKDLHEKASTHAGHDGHASQDNPDGHASHAS